MSRIRRPTEIPEALPVILTVYAAVVDGGLRASIFGGAHRLEMAAMFDRLPEHGDNLRKLACRQGSLGVCSWKQSLAPRSAVLTVTQPPTSISQQRAAMLDALQSSIPIAAKLRDQSSPTKDDAKEERCEAVLARPAPTDVASAEPDPPSSQPVSAPSSCRSLLVHVITVARACGIERASACVGQASLDMCFHVDERFFFKEPSRWGNISYLVPGQIGSWFGDLWPG